MDTYAKITETFTLTVADFYNLKVEFVFDLFKIQLLKPVVTFVHPWAIFVAKNEDPSVALPFDVKLMTEFKIDKLLDVRITASDDMRANFNKKLDDLVKEAFTFAGTAFTGEEYVLPEDDTKNIVDPMNYLPAYPKDFKKGGQVFTNPFAPETPTRRIPKTRWDIPVVLEVIRLIYKNPTWEWDPQAPLNHWIFKTRDNKLDTLV